MASETLELRGVLKGHRGWVTGIATCFENANTLISSSRDKTVMVWELTPNDSEPGYARKCLTGHNQAVQDVVTSSDGQFALSASWDKTMRLWNSLAECKYTITEDAHSDWVSQVRFSP